jgi:Zn-dependent M32 family carboxypeptidase
VLTSFIGCAAGTIHETGHAMYNQGRNLKWDGLPVYQAMDTTIHESQVGRTRLHSPTTHLPAGCGGG